MARFKSMGRAPVFKRLERWTIVYILVLVLVSVYFLLWNPVAFKRLEPHRPTCHPKDVCYNFTCPRYICVPTNVMGGLGHRLSNVMQTYLLSLDLNIPILAPALDTPGPLHGAYKGANDLFFVPAPMPCPGSAHSWGIPFGWRTQHLALHTENKMGVDWKGFPTPGFASELISKTQDCHTIYTVSEFWPYTMERVRLQLKQVYRPYSFTGMELRSALRFRRTHFTIAIHARIGDISPTPVTYFVATLKSVLARLDPDGTLPVDVWVFSESPYLLEAPLLAAGFKGLSFHFDTAGLSALSTLVHFLESDVVLGSDSSLSWFAAYLSGDRPLFLTAPNSRESPDFQNFMKGNIRVDTSSKFDDSGRLNFAAKQWHATRPSSLRHCNNTVWWVAPPSGAHLQRLQYIETYQAKLFSLNGKVFGHRAFDIAPAPYLASDSLIRIGTAKNGQWVIASGLLGLDCTILSLKSKVDFSFEEHAAVITGCHVHTMYCGTSGTLGPAHSEANKGRVHFKHSCIDFSEETRCMVINPASSHLRDLRGVQLLNIDLEGYEGRVVDDLLRSFLTDPTFSLYLPPQLVLSVRHTDLPDIDPGIQMPLGALGAIFLHLAELGYTLGYREDSIQCPFCSSFTYIRTACLGDT